MPRSPSLLEVYPGYSSSSVVLILDTDAYHFWRALRSHALHDLTPLFGNIGEYRVSVTAIQTLGYWWGGEAARTFTNDEIGVAQAHIWFDARGPDAKSTPHYDATLVAWEMLSPYRLRVVVRAGSDSIPVIERTGHILRVIGELYPEARPQLTDLDAVLKSWEYDPKRPHLRSERQAWSLEEAELPRPNHILHLIVHLGRGGPDWWRALFEWYEKYVKGFRFTQRDLADLIGYSLSHTKKELQKYRAQFGKAIPNDTE